MRGEGCPEPRARYKKRPAVPGGPLLISLSLSDVTPCCLSLSGATFLLLVLTDQNQLAPAHLRLGLDAWVLVQ